MHKTVCILYRCGLSLCLRTWSPTLSAPARRMPAVMESCWMDTTSPRTYEFISDDMRSAVPVSPIYRHVGYPFTYSSYRAAHPLSPHPHG